MSIKFHDETIAGTTEVDLALDASSSNAVANSAVVAGLNSTILAYKCFEVGTTPPSNTNVLWIDLNNGLKYHDGSTWVTVPVAYQD